MVRMNGFRRTDPAYDRSGSKWAGVRAAGRSLAMAVGMTLLPLAVWAQDEDEKFVPMDPQTKKLQTTMFCIIGVLIIAALVWYRWRVWQIKKTGGSSVDSSLRNQD